MSKPTDHRNISLFEKVIKLATVRPNAKQNSLAVIAVPHLKQDIFSVRSSKGSLFRNKHIQTLTSHRMANPNALNAPQWVYARLEATAAKARYETSYYGPMNSWLVSYFTVVNGFMIKPQPKIRPPFTPEGEDARVSIDSYENEVRPRELGGRETKLRSPDFIIVRATDNIAKDRMILIIEIKLGRIPLQLAMEQLMDYLLSMRKKIRLKPSHPLFNRDIRGMLVIGYQVRIISLNVDGSQGFAGPYPFRDGQLHGILLGLAQ